MTIKEDRVADALQFIKKQNSKRKGGNLSPYINAQKSD